MRIRAFITSLLLLAWALAGCQSSQPGTDPKRFTEAPFVDVVLRFTSWDCIFVTKPLLREHGFQRVFTRNDVLPAVTAATPRRGFAVVVCHKARQLDGDVQRDMAAWIALLQSGGFERVVILRAGFEHETLDGLEILEDSQRQPAR